MTANTLGNREKLALLTLSLVALTVGTDFTGILLLVPPIEAAFGIDITTAQWIVNTYALTFGMFMVAGGKLGDTYGRHLLIGIGLTLFVLSSLICSLAADVSVLIFGRALQGLGAAMIWPNAIGEAATVVPEETRSIAIGLILASVTTGNVVGPLLSGVLTEFASWRYFFGINAVLSLLCLMLCIFVLPKSETDLERERVDLAGIATLGLASLGLLYALDVGADWGWLDRNLLIIVGASAVLFAVFPLIEGRVKEPMVSPHWLGNRQFFIFLILNGLAMPAVFAGFLYFPQYLAKVLGWTGLSVSYGITPMMMTLAVVSFVSGVIYPRTRPRNLIAGGFCAVAIGLLVFILGSPSLGYTAAMVSMVLMAFGGALVVGPAGTATVSLVPEKNAALASGLGFMVHLVVGAIGLAGATAILYGSSLSNLTTSLATAGIKLSSKDITTLNAAARDNPQVIELMAKLDSRTVTQLHAAMREAFETGMINAYWVGFGFVILGLVLALIVDDQTSNSALLDTRTDTDEPSQQ
ncbi:MAG: MFS transporter [Pseudomonadota bacterium]